MKSAKKYSEPVPIVYTIYWNLCGRDELSNSISYFVLPELGKYSNSSRHSIRTKIHNLARIGLQLLRISATRSLPQTAPAAPWTGGRAWRRCLPPEDAAAGGRSPRCRAWPWAAAMPRGPGTAVRAWQQLHKQLYTYLRLFSVIYVYLLALHELFCFSLYTGKHKNGILHFSFIIHMIQY